MGILLVDDANIMRIVIKGVLKDVLGIGPEYIVECSTGGAAVKVYKEMQPHVVFLDMYMPDMNGVEVVKEIKQQDPDCYIIMCTSANKKAMVVECIRAGAKDYIVKPPTSEKLVRALEKYCNTVRSSAQDVYEDAEENSVIKPDAEGLDNAVKPASSAAKTSAANIIEPSTAKELEKFILDNENNYEIDDSDYVVPVDTYKPNIQTNPVSASVNHSESPSADGDDFLVFLEQRLEAMVR